MLTQVNTYEWTYFSYETAGATGSDKSADLGGQLHTLPIGLHVEFVAVATVGNRFITVDYRDASGTVLCRCTAGKEQAENTSRVYDFFPGAPFMSDFYATTNLLIPLPQVLIPPGGSLRVRDSQSVDAASDTVDFYLTAYQRRA